MKKLVYSLMVFAAFWLACAKNVQPPMQNQETPKPTATGLNQLQKVDVQALSANEQPIEFVSNGLLSPNIFKLSDPDRIVVDLTDTKLSGPQSVESIKQGYVEEITANQFDDEKSSLSRVVIVLNKSVDFETKNDGSKLVLVLKNVGDNSLDSTTATAASSSNEGMQFAADDSPIPDLSSTSQGVLENIEIEKKQDGVSIKLVGQGLVGRYEDFVLSDPSRIVLDLKGTLSKLKKNKNFTVGTEQLSQVRIGQSGSDVRVVFDSPSVGAPSYDVIASGQDLIVTVPSQNMASKALTGESLPVDASVYETEIVANNQSGAVSPPLANETTSTLTSDEGTSASGITFESTKQSPAPLASYDGPVKITALDFKQMEGHSRLTVQLDHVDVAIETIEERDGFSIKIPKAKFEKASLKRPLVTKEFNTAILDVSMQEKKNFSLIKVRMDQKVPYNVSMQQSNVVVDVEIPQTIARAQTKELASAPSSNETENGEFKEQNAQKEDLLLQEQESIAMPMTETKQVVEKSSEKKSYNYVKEEFINDSVGGNEPLSEMGAILSGAVSGRKFTGRKISMDFKDADVRSIFRLIADISKFNIIISDDVDGRITIRLDDVPWDQAFAIILQTRSLWFEKYGSIIRVAPAEKLKRERESAAQAARAAIAAKPLDVLFKPVSFAEASTLTKQVQTVLSERGTVDIDSRTNTLIIKDVREHLEKAKRMVEILDTQTPQVTIESRIVEATSTFTRSFGIQWGGNARFTSSTGNPTGLFFPNNVNVSPFALNFPVEAGFINSTANLSLGSINNIIDLDLALALGEQEGHSKLISAPKVTVLDNRAANITAGTRIPFLTQTANAGSNVRFENATTALSVTPHITNDGSVLMMINATRNEPNFSQLVQGNPIIDQRAANTEVLVKSGNTTVIGGIYSTQTARSQSRFPVLHRIPIVGALFRNYDRQIRRTELLIFVTPRIVGDEREAVKDIRG